MFKLNICTNPYTHNKTHDTNNKKKHEKSALEATILELNIKKSKLEASILAIFTDGSSGGSTISSLGGNSQAGIAFRGREEKAQIKKRLGIWCVADPYYG